MPGKGRAKWPQSRLGARLATAWIVVLMNAMPGEPPNTEGGGIRVPQASAQARLCGEVNDSGDVATAAGKNVSGRSSRHLPGDQDQLELSQAKSPGIECR